MFSLSKPQAGWLGDISWLFKSRGDTGNRRQWDNNWGNRRTRVLVLLRGNSGLHFTLQVLVMKTSVTPYPGREGKLEPSWCRQTCLLRGMAEWINRVGWWHQWTFSGPEKRPGMCTTQTTYKQWKVFRKKKNECEALRFRVKPHCSRWPTFPPRWPLVVKSSKKKGKMHTISNLQILVREIKLRIRKGMTLQSRRMVTSLISMPTLRSAYLTNILNQEI